MLVFNSATVFIGIDWHLMPLYGIDPDSLSTTLTDTSLGIIQRRKPGLKKSTATNIILVLISTAFRRPKIVLIDDEI